MGRAPGSLQTITTGGDGAWPAVLVALAVMVTTVLLPAMAGLQDMAPTEGSQAEPMGGVGADSQATDPLAALPGWFTPNQGQLADEAVRFIHSQGDAAFLKSAVVLEAGSGEDRATVKLTFPGSSTVTPEGSGLLAHRTNYFRGSDPAGWHTGLPNYQRVVYPDLYSGIDLVYYSTASGLKYDWVVQPGADPSAIREHFEGATQIGLGAHGGLIVTTPAGELREAPPRAFQGSTEVPVAFQLHGDMLAYEVGPYDPALPLVIDPLVYSTFVGGGESDNGYALVLDEEGNVYVTGDTYSDDFPTTAGIYDDSFNGVRDIFVFKLSVDGSRLVYSTFVGGDNNEVGHGLAVDSEGSAYVTGRSQSTDFPTTDGAYDTTHNGGSDVVVFKLSPDGSALEYSTFVGGNDYEVGFAGVAVDGSGSAYVAGHTHSADFPTTPGAYDRTYYCCGWDGFAFKLEPDGSALAYSTYFGGYDYEGARSLALDSGGNLYLTGDTTSTDYPTTSGAYDETYNGGRDGFALKLNSAGSELVFSTYLGDTDDDIGDAIALGGDGTVWVTGETKSTGFPTTSTAYDESHNGERDIFVSRLSADGSDLGYSTFIGGNSHENSYGMVVTGEVVSLAGWSWSANFPVTGDAYDSSLGGDKDAIVLKLDTGTNSSLVYSTYIGGGKGEKAQGLALRDGDFIITGFTDSPDFPTTEGAYDRSYNGDFLDVFVLRLDPSSVQPGEGGDGEGGGGGGLSGLGLVLVSGLAAALAVGVFLGVRRRDR